MASRAYDFVNGAWKKTCTVLLGQQVGELSNFYDWLEEYPGKPRMEKSFLSGKQVEAGLGDYADGQKFISFDEVDFNRKFKPLSQNEIKDIDSIVQAIQDRVAYTGNVVLGNSSEVDESSSVIDCNFVLRSNVVSDCKYIACCRETRRSEYCFGYRVGGESSFAIRCGGGKLIRCLECIHCETCSDIHFSHNCENVRDSMFCFNAKNLSCAIGNAQLAPDVYKSAKASLLSQIADELERKKDLKWDILKLGANTTLY